MIDSETRESGPSQSPTQAKEGACWARWQDVAGGTRSLHWLAIVDSAQDARLPRALSSEPAHCHGLFGATLGSPRGDVSPWLVELPPPARPDDMPWRWVLRETPRCPASLSVIASHADAAGTLAHLERFMNIRLPDEDDSLLLALWDPAILGTLCGQPDDRTLHVPGPILTEAQRRSLMSPFAAWWYCDRDGHWHEVTAEDAAGNTVQPPLRLSQEQTDQLVEASVPDHVLYHLGTNQPLLLERVPREERYRRIRDLVSRARDHGLQSQRDLVNFCCASLIYGPRLDSDPTLQTLLQRLKRGERSLDELLPEFPE